MQDDSLKEAFGKDLEVFLTSTQDCLSSVLIFPCINSYSRLKLHEVTKEKYPQLTSFSVGVEPDRRPIICRQKLIADWTLKSLCGAPMPTTPATAAMKEGYNKAFTPATPTPTIPPTIPPTVTPTTTLTITPTVMPAVTCSPAQEGYNKAFTSATPTPTITPTITPTVAASTQRTRTPGKRPERALFVPRAKRLQQNSSENTAPTTAPSSVLENKGDFFSRTQFN